MFIKFWTLDEVPKDTCDLVVTNKTENIRPVRIITLRIISVVFKLFSKEQRESLLKIFIQIRSKSIQDCEESYSQPVVRNIDNKFKKI
jgi:hypothetical protein